MASDLQLCRILDETNAALSTFDLDRLLMLLEQADALRIAGADVAAEGCGAVAKKHQLLSALLNATESNLNLLRRLHEGSR